MTKTCIKCGAEKALEMFVRDRNYKDGYRGLCKVCNRLRQKNDRKTHAVNASKIRKFPPFKGYGLPEWRIA